MAFIKEYINTLVEDGADGNGIAEHLGVSVSMVSSYKLHEYNPSLAVAKTVFKKTGIVLHPFSGDALKFEISKDK